jgi:hypothetical protein
VITQEYVLSSDPESYPDPTGSVNNWRSGSGSLQFYQRIKEISEKVQYFTFLVLSKIRIRIRIWPDPGNKSAFRI